MFFVFFLLAFFVCSSSPFSLNPPSDSMFLTQRGPRKCLSSSLVRWRVDQEEVGGGWYVTRERKERGMENILAYRSDSCHSFLILSYHTHFR